MNTNLLIDSKFIENARIICNSIYDTEIRNRAVANVLAADISEDFFKDSSYTVDTFSGLHSMGVILEDIDISDIYINGHYVDVRLCFDEREMSVPISHFDNNMIPEAYMFIKVSPDLSSGVVKGFIRPDDVDTSVSSEGFYPVDSRNMKSFIEIAPYFMEKATENRNISSVDVFNYTEGNIKEKVDFYRKLIHDSEGRALLKQTLKAQNIFNLITVNTNQDNKDTTTDEVVDDFSELLETDLDNKNDADNTGLYEYATEISPSVDIDALMGEPHEGTNPENDETIDDLFIQDTDINSNDEEPERVIPAKKKFSLVPLLPILLLLGVIGYYGYKYISNSISAQTPLKQPITKEKSVSPTEQDVMPIESVEKKVSINNQEEGTSISIPAIERDIDASIYVSNLKIQWEVPQGYLANNAAQRYLKKMGKIIHLNLKTELLLLSKPPITNKISVELKYNSVKKIFETEKIILSSGESSVDNVVLKTVNEVLKKKISQNSEIFEKLEGNPVLVISL